jgi:putative ATP-binding cassette transporter
MEAGHQYLVTYMPGEHSNPDGRVAEDIRNTTEFAIDLVHSFFYCVLLLVSFIQILWSLSGVPELDIAGIHLYLPGHLVWVAVLYAAAGAAIAWLLGRPMVRASDRRQTFEANFRFGLVHARENALAVALLHGESDERTRFADLFKGVAEAWNRQTSALINFFYFQTSWSVLLQVFPILVAAPRFIAGTITLGALMQISQAFQQAVSAMSWPIDNLAKVADWRASVERVLALHEAIQRLMSHIATDGHAIIDTVPSSDSRLTFQQVTIADPNGDTAVRAFDLDIRGGERVLIGGDTGAALKLLKAAVTLWPWGSGRIELPNTPIFFAPQRPYLPIGSLRDAIAYPAIAKPLDDTMLGAILERVGLHHLVARLDQVENWEQVLAADEQQRLGFARLFVHRPAWIFIQEATDALDPEEEAKMMALLVKELPEATVMTIGHHAGLIPYHRRQLSLVRHDGYAVVEENKIV